MSEPLSSDVLESQFGPTEIEILRQDSATRIICTKVVDGGQVLELSRVIFKKPGSAAFPDVHRAVLAGESMGKAFAERGIVFKRQIRAIYVCERPELPDSFAQRFGAEGPATIVSVSVSVGPDATPYANILEIYSPAVSWPQASGPMGQEASAAVRAFDELLTGLDG